MRRLFATLPEGTCEYFPEREWPNGGGSDGNRDHSECSIANGNNNKSGFDDSDSSGDDGSCASNGNPCVGNAVRGL